VAVAIAGLEKHGMHETTDPGCIAEDTDDSKSMGTIEIIECCFPGDVATPPPPMGFPAWDDDCVQGDDAAADATVPHAIRLSLLLLLLLLQLLRCTSPKRIHRKDRGLDLAWRSHDT
jgi:hypothetical protein